MAKKPQNPFDPAFMQSLFDPARIMEEYGKALQAYTVPGLDVPHLLESHRRNLDALTRANQQIMAGAQAVIQRQTELMQKALQEATTTASSLSAGSPTEMAGKQSELMSQAYTRACENMLEASQALDAAYREALETLNRRWQEGMKEIRALGQGGSRKGPGK